MRALVAALGLVAARAALGQCQWLPGDGIPGVSSTARAAVAWDPDGPGPLPQRLVVGGGFSLAGETSTSSCAAWDGAEWHAMPTPAQASVSCLLTVAQDLYAGTATGVLHWDGADWQYVGNPVGNALALAVFNGELHVGGLLSGLTGGPRLARWDGAAWQPVPGQPNNNVLALLPDGDTLLVGGQFTTVGNNQTDWGLARFDGQDWTSVGPDPHTPNGAVRALAFFNDELYATGGFFISGTSERSFAKFNGTSWVSVGGGLTGDGYALLPVGNRLYVGGEFTIAGVTGLTGGCTFWDGAQWAPIGFARSTYALAAMGPDIFAAGSFTSAGPVACRNIARFDGSAWHELGRGFNSPVTALTDFNGDLIAGGMFTHAGGVTTGSVARRIASGWQPMGGAFNAQPAALAVHNGDLYAGGNFSTIGGVPISRIARWDGAAWVGVNAGSFNGPVSALAEHNGELICGGSFTTTGTPNTLRVARLNGSAWTEVSGGLGSVSPGAAQVLCLLSTDSGLYAGGIFTVPPGTTRSVGRWDGGAWQPVGLGVGTSENSVVRALAVYDGQLYAAGGITILPQGTLTPIGRWTGATWQSVASGLVTTINALAVHEGRLIAGGGFALIDGVAAANLAQYDGQAWSPLAGNGVGGIVNAVLARQDELDVGGNFLTANNHASAYVAILACTCYPNCDGSTVAPILNVNDFTCFLNRFAAGDAYANCDASTTPPVLNVLDFTCFLNAFVTGCP